MTSKKPATSLGRRNRLPGSSPVYPFAAIVSQEEMKLGLILNVIDPSIGGVLIMGHRGTGKSTAVRGLADLLPERWVIKGCAYQCDPRDSKAACDACRARLASGKKMERERARVAVVDLPLGATEDRVCGAIDIQQALVDGVKAFEPGVLARANRGFLYIDEVNLLEDHLVDLLLDVAATGENKVERENISVSHPARFVLIGSGNPEEGELRPQLLDRFGLSVEVKTEVGLDQRVEIVERRQAYDENPEAFAGHFAAEQTRLRKQITSAQKHLASTKVERPLLRKIAQLCSELQVDGHRGELTITRAARALAAFAGKKKVDVSEIKQVAAMALRHRLRRDPLEEKANSERIQQAVEKSFAAPRSTRDDGSRDDGDESGGTTVRPSASPGPRNPEDRRRVAHASLAEAASGQPASMLIGSDDNDVSVPELPAAPGTENHVPSNAKGRALSRSVRNHLRGRYVRGTRERREGSRLAVDSTLRAMACSQRVTNGGVRRKICADDLRFKELSCKRGGLFIFAIDTSGSMALHRIKQAKVVVLNLLKQSYVKRDQVAIVGFRGDSAETYLPASRSILRARRVLDSLRVGGGTPLSAGLSCALKLAKLVRNRVGETSVLLFTDGNANVPVTGATFTDRRARQAIIDKELRILGAEFAKESVGIVVVDTQNSFIRTGNAEVIARRLRGQYRLLPVQSDKKRIGI